MIVDTPKKYYPWTRPFSYFVSKTDNKSLGWRLSFVSIVVVLVIFSVLASVLYFTLSREAQTQLSLRLQHIAASAALAVPHDAHNKILRDVLRQRPDVAERSAFKRVQGILKQVQASNNLSSDVYTVIVPDWSPEHIMFVAMSSDEPYVGNGQDKPPIIAKVYETKQAGYSDIYVTPQGEWISGVAPMLDADGAVIGVLQVDYEVSGELASAKIRLLGTLVIACVIASLCFWVVMRRFASGLSRQVNDIADKLEFETGQLVHTSSLIREGGEELNTSCSQQDVLVETFASTIEELRATVSQNNEFIHGTSDLSTQCKDESTANISTIEQLNDSIQRIEAAYTSLGEHIGHNYDEMKTIISMTEEIEQSTETINDIIDKTELLALNAKIEAARAGTYGRTFGIVAQEVKELSNLCKNSLEEIKQTNSRFADTVDSMIKKAMSKNKELTANVKAEIDHSKQHTLQCVDSLGEMVRNFDQVDDMIGHIVTAAEQQISVLDTSQRSIVDILQVIRENRTRAESSLDICQGLNEKTDVLTTLTTDMSSVVKGKAALANY